MSARTFVYGLMTNRPSLTDLIGGDEPRIFAKKTMTSSLEVHPYLVYKLGNETNRNFSEGYDISNQFIQVWVHDYHDGDSADYMLIDKVLAEVKAALVGQQSGDDLVWNIEWLETSQDLNDDTLNTVFRYARFQMVKADDSSGVMP